MLDKAIVVSCLIFAVLRGWAAGGPSGLGLPIAAQVIVSAAILCCCFVGYRFAAETLNQRKTSAGEAIRDAKPSLVAGSGSSLSDA
jgi:hypothetical protein